MAKNKRRKPRVKVYSLLSLDRKNIRKIIPGVQVAYPIRRGDLLKDIDDQFDVVVIIDGVFEQGLPVSPDEIMEAMRCGVKVYGASSMGAMRAAELDRYGMIGCGRIYEYIKENGSFCDDHLGQTYFSQGGNISPIGFTYIDFEFALRDLLNNFELSRKQFAILTQMYRKLFYSDRTIQGFRQLLKKNRLEALWPKLQLALNLDQSQKKLDAVSVLKKVKSDLADSLKMNRKLNR